MTTDEEIPAGMKMSPKLKAYIESCTKEELRELIELGALVADPLSQELLERLAD